jgi:hypothetical protein
VCYSSQQVAFQRTEIMPCDVLGKRAEAVRAKNELQLRASRESSSEVQTASSAA